MFVNEGFIYALKVITGQTALETIKVGLYTNALVWGPATTFADIVEPTQSGYAQETPAGFATPVIDGLGNGNTLGSSVTWHNTDVTDITAIGYFFLTGTTSQLLGGAAFTAPVVIPNTSGIYAGNPNLLDNTL